MGFASGAVSFQRFAVIGQQPKVIDQDVLDRLGEHALKERELGVPEEEEYGWIGGRHILDGQFSFENNVFADCLFCGLRLDTNRVPGSLKTAYRIMEEDAAAKGNPSGFISKQQKRTAKDTVRRKLEDELRSGRFRRSKMLPMLWDLPSATVYCSAGGKSQEKLLEIFERTFGLELQPISGGSLAQRLLESQGKRRDYEDLRPTRFVPGPEGEGQQPDYPWVAKGPQPKDFLGNEFLLWLWHELQHGSGAIKGEAGRDISILLDKSVDLDCAYGQTGRDSLRGDGATQMPEAMDALRSGKLPRKVSMILDGNGQQYQFAFNAETFGFGSAKLPEVEEAENERVLFEERIGLLRDLCKMIDGVYAGFLKSRASSGWESAAGRIRKWILTTSRPIAAVA
jgi:recombination associated protein RdgC